MGDPLTARPDAVELESLRHLRLANLRAHLADAGIDVCVVTNPVNIRYATDYRGYAGFQSRIPSQYLIVPVTGPVVLHGAYTDDLTTVDRCAVAHSVTTFDAGLDLRTAAIRFADDVKLAIRDSGLASTATVAIERATPSGLGALASAGLRVVDAEPTIELARSRKLPGEVSAMRHAIDVAEAGIDAMRTALAPGISENELFALLHLTNVANDGDWIDGRMLCSGPRTNPWYQEASSRAIRRGDLVAFDTDMIGPLGYCADISRTWVCGGEPTAGQLALHELAAAEIEHNTALLKVGASFAELSDSVLKQPPEVRANRYACAFHGVGMSDEYPKIPYPDDWEWTGYDGEIEDGMVLSVESYVGPAGGVEGVKLEQMVQVTEHGVEPLSRYPLSLAVTGPRPNETVCA